VPANILRSSQDFIPIGHNRAVDAANFAVEFLIFQQAVHPTNHLIDRNPVVGH